MLADRIRVLVTEDNEDTRELYALVLGECNYEVVTANGVSDTLEVLRTQKFDIVLLDSMLPDGSGITLCRTIRERDRTTPIIFCSGLAFEKDRQEALLAGAQDYLVKPFYPNSLCEKVADLVAKSRTLPAMPQRRGRPSGELAEPTLQA